MEFVDGLDVCEHLREGSGREELVGTVLLVHTEVKHLEIKNNSTEETEMSVPGHISKSNVPVSHSQQQEIIFSFEQRRKNNASQTDLRLFTLHKKARTNQKCQVAFGSHIILRVLSKRSYFFFSFSKHFIDHADKWTDFHPKKLPSICLEEEVSLTLFCVGCFSLAQTKNILASFRYSHQFMVPTAAAKAIIGSLGPTVHQCKD